MRGSPGVEPEAVAAAAVSCPSVTRLSGGRVGEVATYLPGRRVVGVRFTDSTVEVHVVGVYGPSVGQIGAEVTAAVTPLVRDHSLHVVVEDLDLPDAGGGRPDV